MALPQPGTIDFSNYREVMRTEYFAPLSSRWLQIISERLPSYVHYADGKYTYITPDKFFWHEQPPGPSDCDWIVPGSY